MNPTMMLTLLVAALGGVRLEREPPLAALKVGRGENRIDHIGSASRALRVRARPKEDGLLPARRARPQGHLPRVLGAPAAHR